MKLAKQALVALIKEELDTLSSLLRYGEWPDERRKPRPMAGSTNPVYDDWDKFVWPYDDKLSTSWEGALGYSPYEYGQGTLAPSWEDALGHSGESPSDRRARYKALKYAPWADAMEAADTRGWGWGSLEERKSLEELEAHQLQRKITAKPKKALIKSPAVLAKVPERRPEKRSKKVAKKLGGIKWKGSTPSSEIPSAPAGYDPSKPAYKKWKEQYGEKVFGKGTSGLGSSTEYEELDEACNEKRIKLTKQQLIEIIKEELRKLRRVYS